MKRYIHYIFILTVGIILNACEDSFPIGGVPSLTEDYMGDYDSYVSVTDVSLNLSSLSLYKGESETLSVIVMPENATNRDVTWTSSNMSVATVDDNGKVTAVKSGTTTITVTSVSDISKYAKCKVTVTDATSIQHESVDLGLTSGTLWASCNIGASSPEDYGKYYAWGETTAKSTYTESSNTYLANPMTLPLDRDAANANWGGSWCMPTEAEFQELRDECTWTWTTVNGKSGYKVSSKKNSNYIFLPAAGVMYSSSLQFTSYGYYWSSSLFVNALTSSPVVLSISEKNILMPYYKRYMGLSVRPVIRKKTSDEELDDKVFTVSGVTFKMKPVEGGTFQMGATPEQENLSSNEKPVHNVTLSSYYIGETEVTQELWESVMGSNPSYHKGSSNPVEEVSWNDCQEFISKLNAATGQRFRLPTEAEWEYAARGGNKSRGYQYSGGNTLGDVAWCEGNSGDKTHPVKTKQANELGIHDMSGNVMEWCQDWYGSYSSSSQTNPTGPSTGSYHVVRGGDYCQDSSFCGIAFRGALDPDGSMFIIGFRLALSE